MFDTSVVADVRYRDVGLTLGLFSIVPLGWICNPAQLAFFAREGRLVLYAVFFHHQWYNEEVCLLLPSMPFHSHYRFNIELQIQPNENIKGIPNIRHDGLAVSFSPYFEIM